MDEHIQKIKESVEQLEKTKHSIDPELSNNYFKKVIKSYSYKKARLIIPKEILALTLLNLIDDHLEDPNHSSTFISLNSLKGYCDLDHGRRTSATKYLILKKYITKDSRNLYTRTKKRYRKTDFTLKNNNKDIPE